MTQRIQFIIDALVAGGAERQLIYLIAGLDRERFSPTVLTLYNESVHPYHFKPDLDALNVPIISLNLPREGGAKRLPLAVLRYIGLMWQVRPHVVQGCLHTANLIARLGRPFCPPHRLITMNQSLYSPRQLQSERRTAFLTDRIVANSQRNRRHIIENGGLSPAKVTYINCGVDYEQFASNPNPNLRAELLPDSTFTAVMVARIDPRKDHATLLRAIALLRDRLPAGFRLVLVGSISDDDTQRQIEAFIAQNDIGRYVVQLPAAQDVRPYYHMADVAVLSSSSEAFGLVLVEAFAAGKPAIASSVANALGIVQDGVTGWEFSAGDADALARCLQAAWQLTPEDRRQMGERARAAVPAYSVGQMVSQYLRLYDDPKAQLQTKT